MNIEKNKTVKEHVLMERQWKNGRIERIKKEMTQWIPTLTHTHCCDNVNYDVKF